MIDLLFKFINVGILIGIVYYFFRTMISPTIKNKIAQEQLVTQNLHEERAQLLMSQKILDEKLDEQGRQCQSLKSKIDDWRQVVEQSALQKQAEAETIKAHVERKVAVQKQNYELRAYQEQLSGSVIETLEKELKTYFDSADKGEKYLETALKKLERVRL